jgi:hypothetical protein
MKDIKQGAELRQQLKEILERNTRGELTDFEAWSLCKQLLISSGVIDGPEEK